MSGREVVAPVLLSFVRRRSEKTDCARHGEPMLGTKLG